MAAESGAALAGALRAMEAETRWQPLEVAFWLATLLPFVLFPS
jgi:hypothetical protein